MKNKKILLILLIITIVSSAWGTRFYYVNKDIKLPEIQIFPKGVPVPIENDFFYTSEEKMAGYSVTVLDSKLLPVDKFLQQYDALDQKDSLLSFTDYIYTVKVSIENKDNPYLNEKGVDMFSYHLRGTDYVLTLEDICYGIANPDMPGMSFSLRENSSLEVLLPFNVMTDETSLEHIQEDIPKLLVTLYPHQKMIELY